MINNDTDTKIIGLVPIGSTVMITDSSDPRFPHPWTGRLVTVVSSTGGVGGIGGGGSVKITDESGNVSDVSRYTRVRSVPVDESPVVSRGTATVTRSDESDDMTDGERYVITLPSGLKIIVDDFTDQPIDRASVDVWVITDRNESVRVDIGDTPADGFATYTFPA